MMGEGRQRTERYRRDGQIGAGLKDRHIQGEEVPVRKKAYADSPTGLEARSRKGSKNLRNWSGHLRWKVLEVLPS